jgi:hypothetical protein
MSAELREISERIASAIARRDTNALGAFLAPGFVHRSYGGTRSDGAAFLQAIAEIPGEIRFIRLEEVSVDECTTGALVTGVQHAQVAVDGEVIDDRRAFVDWFVRHDGEWRIQAAVDLPVPG